MFSYLNKIGNILDEIDGSKEGTSEEPPSSEVAQADASAQPRGAWGDLLASASSAGAVASGMAAAKAREAFTSLMTEEEEDALQDADPAADATAEAHEAEVAEVVDPASEVSDQSWIMEEIPRARGAVELEASEMPRSREAFSEDVRQEAPLRAEAFAFDLMTNSQAMGETLDPPPVANGHTEQVHATQAESPSEFVPNEAVQTSFEQPVINAINANGHDAPFIEAAVPEPDAVLLQSVQAAATMPDEPVEAAFPSQPLQAAATMPDEPVEVAFPSQPLQAAATVSDEPVEAAFPSQPLQAATSTIVHDEPVEAVQANGSLHLEAEVEQVRAEYEARLMGAAQQIGHLQGRIEELETDVANAKTFELQHTEKMERTMLALMEQRKATEQAEAQVEVLRQEVLSTEQRAKAKASQDSDAALGQVREEMEKELEHLLKQKDDQLRALENKFSSTERSRQSSVRDLEFAQQEVEKLQMQLEQLRSDSAGKSSDHQRSVEQLTLDFQARLEALDEQKSLEARQKHELTLSLRSVEERSRVDLGQVEAQRDQLEMQCTALQGQLQEEQQKSVELSVSLGEAQHRLAHLEEGQGGADAEALREAKARELQERAHVAEEKLLEAQSMRDMFAKETEMYRNELKVSRDEKTLLEEDMKRLQERLRELNVSAKAGAGQEAVLEAVQKDFESRMERYRDEVQYLRQKCDEKERRCEQLMAEKGALSVELRMDAGPVPSTDEDIESGVVSKTGTAAKAQPGRMMRSLPLATPAWLRSADEPLKLVLRTLATVPAARLTFFTYVILLHAWVLFILQQMALHPSS